MKKLSSKENTFIKVLRIILIIILFPVVLVYVIRKKMQLSKQTKANKEAVKVYKITQIDSLSGVEFENMLKVLFEKMGYKSTLTKKSKDYGADLILSKNNKEVIVQAKCYSKTVGIKAVQEAISAKGYYKADYAMVVTNNYFSKEAENLALNSGVGLLARDELLSLVLRYDIHIQKSDVTFSALSETERAKLESKYKFMI